MRRCVVYTIDAQSYNIKESKLHWNCNGGSWHAFGKLVHRVDGPAIKYDY